jgi:hypothetical protein
MVLTLSFDSTFVSLKKIKCKHIPSIKHALDCISRIHVGFKNGLMEALRKKLETKVYGHRWKCNRKLLAHINVHKVMTTFNIVNVEPHIEAP